MFPNENYEFDIGQPNKSFPAHGMRRSKRKRGMKERSLPYFQATQMGVALYPKDIM